MAKMLWQGSVEVLVEYYGATGLAEKLDVSYQTISNWKTGQREPAPENKRTLVRMAQEEYPEDLARIMDEGVSETDG